MNNFTQSIIAQPLEQFEIIYLGSIGGIPINNSLIYLIFVYLVIRFFFGLALVNMRIVPLNIQIFVEQIYNFVFGLVKQQINVSGYAYFPAVFALFLFILVANLIEMTSIAIKNGFKTLGTPWGIKVFIKAAFWTKIPTITIAIKKEKLNIPSHLTNPEKNLFKLGHEVYHREAHCATCHQADGKGLPAANFPPIAKTKWATQNPDRLIKLALKGMTGPIKVLDKEYNGAMTPFEGLLNDKEMAAVLTYVRNSFGNKASAVKPEQVEAIRAELKGKPALLNPAELLKQHPHQ